MRSGTEVGKLFAIASVLVAATTAVQAANAAVGPGGNVRVNGANRLGANVGGPTNFGPQAGAGAQQAANVALLRQFDANGDGRLDAAERQTMESAAAQLRAGGPDLAKAKWLQQFDTNGNGRLDADEMKAARSALAQGAPAGLQGLPSGGVHSGAPGFGQQGGGPQGNGAAGRPAGANVGGKPSQGDAKAKALEEFDANGDGKLDGKERAAMKKTQAERHKAEVESKKANKMANKKK